MNFLDKILPKLLGIVGFIGFFIMLGAVGYDDMMTEQGIVVEFKETLVKVLIGLVLFSSSIITYLKFYQEGDE